MDAAAELGRDPVSKHQIQPEYGDEQADAEQGCRTRLARPKSQAQTGTGKYSFSLCSVDHEQDWQPYPVDPYSCYNICNHTTCIRPDSHTTFVCLCPLLFLFLFFFGDVNFSEYSVPSLFPLWRVHRTFSLPDSVFLPCDLGLIFDINLCESSN